MKILHAIDDIRKASGASVFCCEAAGGLARLGHEVSIAVSVRMPGDEYPVEPSVRIFTAAEAVSELGNPSVPAPDILHLHGLWTLALHRLSSLARKRAVPCVWSPHGMLAPWAFHYKRWKKLPAWWLYQKRDLKKADMIHVTARSEVEDVRRLGLTNKTAIVPLGVHSIHYCD